MAETELIEGCEYRLWGELWELKRDESGLFLNRSWPGSCGRCCQVRVTKEIVPLMRLAEPSTTSGRPGQHGGS